jgi:biopolymer transport protein ExbB/TolQ
MASFFQADSVDTRRFSSDLIKGMGYIFLCYSAVDYVNILVPPLFTNPNWEFQTVGSMASHVWSVLLGYLLVFIRSPEPLSRQEGFFLRSLSYLALVLSIVYFLLIPLSFTSTYRLYQANLTEVSPQLLQQSQRLEVVRNQVTMASDRELVSLNTLLNPQTSSAQSNTPTELRKQLLAQLNQQQEQLKVQQLQINQQAKLGLFKAFVQTTLGLLISSFAFLWIWRLTRWIRQISLAS